VELLFAENERAEAFNSGAVFPVIQPQSGFPARFLQKTLAGPAIRRGDLWQQQAASISFADQQAVLADFDIADIVDVLHRRKNRNFELDVGKFTEREGRESRIARRRSYRAVRRATKKRARRLHVSDAAAQLATFVKGNEDSMRFSQHTIRYVGQTGRLAQEMGLNRISRDLQKDLPIAVSELEHRELELADAVFSAAESSAAVHAV